jgi:hypothetical protein
VTSFALSSLAFILARPWNHLWWLAHSIFAAGFFLLSYGVVQAFRTTRSFATIYSQEELMTRLAEEMERTESALQELKRTNLKLEHLAATDPLTGAANRRQFIGMVEAEIGRAKRGGHRSRCLRSTSITSRRSTTRTGIRSATRSCAASSKGVSRQSGHTTGSRGSAARSLWCCCRR